MIRGIIFPTQDSVRARCYGQSNLGEMQVHRLGVGAGQDEVCGHAASGAGRAEEIGPFVAGVPYGAGPGPARSPDPGERALLADPCVRRENRPPDGFLARLTLETRSRAACPSPLREALPLPPPGSFFERFLGTLVGLRVARARPAAAESRAPPVACRQVIAGWALAHRHAEQRPDPRLKIDAPPAYHLACAADRDPPRPGLPTRPSARASGAATLRASGGSRAPTAPRRCSDAPVRRGKGPPDPRLTLLTAGSAGPCRNASQHWSGPPLPARGRSPASAALRDCPSPCPPPHAVPPPSIPSA